MLTLHLKSDIPLFFKCNSYNYMNTRSITSKTFTELLKDTEDLSQKIWLLYMGIRLFGSQRKDETAVSMQGSRTITDVWRLGQGLELDLPLLPTIQEYIRLISRGHFSLGYCPNPARDFVSFYLNTANNDTRTTILELTRMKNFEMVHKILTALGIYTRPAEIQKQEDDCLLISVSYNDVTKLRGCHNSTPWTFFGYEGKLTDFIKIPPDTELNLKVYNPCASVDKEHAKFTGRSL